jgi:hypothetical protein
MNCARVTNFLEENFVSTGFDLPEEVQEHVDDCVRCRAYFKKLVSLGEKLEPMSDMAMTADEAARVHAGLDRALEAVKSPLSSYIPENKIFTITRLAMAAAAVLLMMMVSLNGDFPSGTGLLQDIDDFELNSFETEDLAGLFDTDAIPSLIEGDSASYITDQIRPGQADDILETLTPEELEWLMDNLSVEI